jgi:hypothetical protein
MHIVHFLCILLNKNIFVYATRLCINENVYGDIKGTCLGLKIAKCAKTECADRNVEYNVECNGA